MIKLTRLAIAFSIALAGYSGAALADHHGHKSHDKKEKAEKTEKTYKKNIVETALATGKFKTLAQALTAAELVDALQGEGPFTVFAPTDEAFAKVPPDMLKALLADKAKLQEVLMYHVVSGQVKAEAAAKLTGAKTLAGKDIKISVRDKSVFINEAKVIMADVMASNGVIHVIDKVILPPMNQAAK
ncbi:MAG: fasciclin domain-containing protein [Candidatus Sericytochromatia bacterium]|nr:fasciclin domain-containing protein [Candidatus Sericytochromatia bacterium]